VPGRIAEIARIAALDTVQLHGNESPADYPEGLAIWKAVRVTADFNLAAYADLPVEALLLDGPAGDLYGGSGRTFDWSRAVATGKRIIVAGGLDGDNVARAIEIANPWGVDSCSRIEIENAERYKDHKKMLDYIQAAKAALVA
jgi:phosphoribosylanthranilate isomerase